MANLGAQAGSGLDASDITTGTLGNTVQDNITRLGTVTSGTMNNTIGSNATFPRGHIIQLNQTIDQTATTRAGDKSNYATTGVSCTLENNLQTNSKLFATFSAYTGESSGSHWAIAHILTIYQNGTNVCSNQLSNLTDGNGLSNQGSANGGSNNEYWRGSHQGSVLFTPTGTDTAKKTVELYWRVSSNATFTQHLNSAGHSSTGYNAGATVLTLMEIAQ